MSGATNEECVRNCVNGCVRERVCMCMGAWVHAFKVTKLLY